MLYKGCNWGNFIVRKGNANIFGGKNGVEKRKGFGGCRRQDVKGLLFRLTIIGTLRSLLS